MLFFSNFFFFFLSLVTWSASCAVFRVICLCTFPVDPNWAIRDLCKTCLVVGRVLCHSVCTPGFREMLPRKCYPSERFGFLWRLASKHFKLRSKNFSNIPGGWNLCEMMEVYFEPVHYQSDIAAPAMPRVAGTATGTVRTGCPWISKFLLCSKFLSCLCWCLCHVLF